MRRLALLLVVPVLAACGGEQAASAPKPSQSASPSKSTASATPTKEPPEELRASDVVLTLRETAKQCFGAEGCNLQYKVEPALSGADPDNLASNYEVTYEVRGATEGPVVASFIFYTDGTYDVPVEGFVTTPDRATVLKPVVTAVTAVP